MGFVESVKYAFNKRTKKQTEHSMTLQSILAIAHAIEIKDRYAKQHSIRVAFYCREIAKKMGYSNKKIENLYYMALLHDVGKIAIEDSILNKASELTREEYEAVKRHTEVGGDIVKNTKFIPGLEETVRNHHEWYNGNGYYGVKGEEIPESARIIAVADAYESMSSDRAYRKKLSKEERIKELLNGRGSQFDPHIVDCFLELLEEGISEEEVEAEKESWQTNDVAEAGALLCQVFTEGVQETQNEREKDSFTGFLNRRCFEEKVNQYLLQPKASGTFFMMDLDDFKKINDTYGHAAGDKLIQIFSNVLRDNTREKDFVCRIGGDEFAVFFRELDDDYVIVRCAERIIRAFTRRKWENGYEICSVSIGIMTKYAGDEPMDYAMMYEKADKALYHVKNNGKDDFYQYSVNQGEINADIYNEDSE